MSGAAYSPCTKLGKRIVLHIGYLLLIVDKISLIAAPVGAVTIPIQLGYFGNGFLYFGSKSPSFDNCSFSFSKAIYKLPIPSSCISST